MKLNHYNNFELNILMIINYQIKIECELINVNAKVITKKDIVSSNEKLYESNYSKML